MFISKSGFPETRGNYSLTFADSKTLKSINCASWSSKPVPVMRSCFPYFLADLDKKYRNEKEVDKNISVTCKKYVRF